MPDHNSIAHVARQILPFKYTKRRTAKLLLWAARCNEINAEKWMGDGTTRQCFTQLASLQRMTFDKLERVARWTCRSPQGTTVRRNLGRAR